MCNDDEFRKELIEGLTAVGQFCNDDSTARSCGEKKASLEDGEYSESSCILEDTPGDNLRRTRISGKLFISMTDYKHSRGVADATYAVKPVVATVYE